MFLEYIYKFLQGILIGLGAVLPGISGGVLSVVFHVYQPLMELLSNPRRYYRKHLPTLLPVLLGACVGFLVVARILSVFLTQYPTQSICVFIGLITGMLPSLFAEAKEKGRSTCSLLALIITMSFVFLFLYYLQHSSFRITPGFFWYVFCGFCLALSIIAPGMSFSTLLMPLGLYTPFVDGLGHLSLPVLFPSAVGAVFTILLLSKAVAFLFQRYHSLAYHSILGVVIGATLIILPVDAFQKSLGHFFLHLACLLSGMIVSQLLIRLQNGLIKVN